MQGSFPLLVILCSFTTDSVTFQTRSRILACREYSMSGSTCLQHGKIIQARGCNACEDKTLKPAQIYADVEPSLHLLSWFQQVLPVSRSQMQQLNIRMEPIRSQAMGLKLVEMCWKLHYLLVKQGNHRFNGALLTCLHLHQCFILPL